MCQEQLPPPNLHGTNKLTPLTGVCVFFCVCVFQWATTGSHSTQSVTMDWPWASAFNPDWHCNSVNENRCWNSRNLGLCVLSAFISTWWIDREAAGLTAFGNYVNYFVMQAKINKSLVSEELIQPATWKVGPHVASPPCWGIHEHECVHSLPAPLQANLWPCLWSMLDPASVSFLASISLSELLSLLAAEVHNFLRSV